MDTNNKIEKTLEEINKKLEIILACHRYTLKNIIKDNYLTTDKRTQMYELFDGEHSLQEISKKVNVTVEAIRQFKVVLEKDKLITIHKIGKKEYPQKII
ncbi:MAG: hypothetical protein GF353_04695 [Candidatus Lokiarchaeota archaeon]|nr:hypothetical protein [Candidatus Lokiarchaeota archaeon]